MGNQQDVLLDMLIGVRNSGGKVNPTIVIGCATAILAHSGRGQELASNGGPITLSRDWARKILTHHLQWSKRKATTDRKLTEEQWKTAAKGHLQLEERISDYHPALVIEMDETLAPYCPGR